MVRGLERLGRCFTASDAVYQIDQSVVVDLAMTGQADLAGAAGGDAFIADLHRIFQAAQGVAVELRGGEAFVSVAKPQQ